MRVLCAVSILPVGRRGNGFDPDAVAITWHGQEVVSGFSKLAS